MGGVNEGVGGGGGHGWSLRQTQRILYARFEVQTVIAMSIAMFQNEMTCNMASIYRRV